MAVNTDDQNNVEGEQGEAGEQEESDLDSQAASVQSSSFAMGSVFS